MKDTIRSEFDKISMPQDCGDRILTAMHENKKRANVQHCFVRVTAAAACLIAVTLLLSGPTVVEALEHAVTSVLEVFTEKTDDGTVTVRYNSSDGKFQAWDEYDESGDQIISGGRNNLEITPEWYVEQGDRVYFAGNGEWIDVTDLISMDTPFTYVYTDQGGIIHYICIGGACGPNPELWNVGYAEWYYDPDHVDANGIVGHWIGGYADNYWDKETDDDWPWLQKAKADMGIPWP